METDTIIFNVDNKGQVVDYNTLLEDSSMLSIDSRCGIYMCEQARLALDMNTFIK